MSLRKFNAIALAIFVLTFVLALAGTCTAMSMEIRGTPFDTGSTDTQNLSWDFRNFGAFFFSANKYSNFVNGSGEHLYLEDNGDNPAIGKANPEANIIDEGELVYTTKQIPSKFKAFSEEENVTKVTFFYTLPLFGKSYCAIDNDATHLSKILYQQDENEKVTLKTGESWDLSNGYHITLNEVDVDGNKCYFSLYKNDTELDDALVSTDGAIDDKIFTAEEEFGDNASHVYFVTFVDSVFTSADESFAVFKYTWLIDKDKPLSVESGDKFGNFEVDQALENMIVMSNSDSITINVDADRMTNITDEWYLKTSDKGKGSNGGYVIYPAKTIEIEEKKSNTSGMNATFNTSGNVQIKEENGIQTAGTVENTGKKNEVSNEASMASSEVTDKENESEIADDEIPASSGFSGVMVLSLLASIVYYFRRI